MLYLLGGAARSGKTSIARRFINELHIPSFTTEYFVSAMENGAPELGIRHEDANIERGEKVWPIMKPMIVNILEEEPDYLVEGDILLPQNVRELIDERASGISACFLGYAEIDPGRKLADVREFPGQVNDWLIGHPDKYVLEVISEMIEFSRFLRSECEKFRLPYFDVSKDFQTVLNQVFIRFKGNR